MPIASGRSRPGRRASPPACAMESKPMNEAKSSADAGISTDKVSGGAIDGGHLAAAQCQRCSEVGLRRTRTPPR